MEINIDALIVSQRGIFIDGKSEEYNEIIKPYLSIIELQQKEIEELRKKPVGRKKPVSRKQVKKPKKKTKRKKHA